MKVSHIHYASPADIKQSATSLRPQLILCFAPAELYASLNLTEELGKHFPEAQIIGCSAAGTICGTQVDNTRASLTLLHFEETEVNIVSKAFDAKTNYHDSGANLAHELRGLGLKHVFLFSSGLQSNTSALLDGLSGSLPRQATISGGVAADNHSFTNTACWHNDTILEQGCVAIGLYSESLEVGYGSFSGYDRFGSLRTITKAKANTVYEIDGQPALSLYQRYLGDYAVEMPSSAQLLPLYLLNESDNEKSLVRSISGFNANTGALYFNGEVAEGSKIYLMKGNADGLIEGALISALLAKETFRDRYEPELTLCVAGAGRPMILGSREEDELEKISDNIGDHGYVVGFYGYGEIAPNRHDPGHSLNNQSIAITTLTELI